MTNKKIVIAGGTGFIGTALAAYFGNENTITILTRNTNKPDNNTYGLTTQTINQCKYVEWNGKDTGDWCKEIDGCDIVINLTGKSVNCRYTNKNKQKILNSRVNATLAIGHAIQQAVVPPKLWLNASSATIYRHATDQPQDEYNGEIQDDFSVQVCKKWEEAFFSQRTAFTRKIALRAAITLGVGGVMMPYLHLAKFGLGGYQGNGKQMYSWVHINDVCRCIAFFWQHTNLEGVFNISSPNPVTNKYFMQSLCAAIGQKFAIPAFTWVLKAGAAIIGTETELLLKSRWVLPTKLLQNGFTFQYPQLNDAIENIVASLPRKAISIF